eukprot:1320152-Amorphochlora_amoeboformis.AAC.1
MEMSTVSVRSPSDSIATGGGVRQNRLVTFLGRERLWRDLGEISIIMVSSPRRMVSRSSIINRNRFLAIVLCACAIIPYYTPNPSLGRRWGFKRMSGSKKVGNFRGGCVRNSTSDRYSGLEKDDFFKRKAS